MLLLFVKVPSRPLSVIDFHGLGDRTIPYRFFQIQNVEEEKNQELQWTIITFKIPAKSKKFQAKYKIQQNAEIRIRRLKLQFPWTIWEFHDIMIWLKTAPDQHMLVSQTHDHHCTMG